MKTNMENYKKALGPVVAISLLMVVTVGAVFTFNTFFKGYSSNLQAKSETTGKNEVYLDRVIVESGTLTLFAKTTNSYVIINKAKVNGAECTLTGSNVIDATITSVPVNCGGVSGNNEISLITDSGVYTKEFFIEI